MSYNFKYVWLGLFAVIFISLACGVRAQDIMCIEAESATELKGPVRVVDSVKALTNRNIKVVSGASGGKYLEIPRKDPVSDLVPASAGKSSADDKKGQALLDVKIPGEGKYFFWARVWWAGECSNSFIVEIDGSQSFTFGEDNTFKCWHWVKAVGRIDLSKGKHQFKIREREQNIRIDQVLLTSDKRYVPVGAEKAR